MTDSSSFSSLMALVDSHLSKTAIQESRSEDGNSRFPMPSLHDGQHTALSDTQLSFSPNQRLPLPSISLGASPESSVKSILAEQVANMLKAKALKRQKDKEEEEKLRLEIEMKNLKLQEEDDCVIDLMKALQESYPNTTASKAQVVSSSSSYDSLFEPSFIDDISPPIIPEPIKRLPCTTDMSYVLKNKKRMAKCSPFGRVLTAKLRPVAAPYLFTKIESSIKRFDFSTPSPCDIIKEKRRRPTCSSTIQPNNITSISANHQQY